MSTGTPLCLPPSLSSPSPPPRLLLLFLGPFTFTLWPPPPAFVYFLLFFSNKVRWGWTWWRDVSFTSILFWDTLRYLLYLHHCKPLSLLHFTHQPWRNASTLSDESGFNGFHEGDSVSCILEKEMCILCLLLVNTQKSASITHCIVFQHYSVRDCWNICPSR